MAYSHISGNRASMTVRPIGKRASNNYASLPAHIDTPEEIAEQARQDILAAQRANRLRDERALAEARRVTLINRFMLGAIVVLSMFSVGVLVYAAL